VKSLAHLGELTGRDVSGVDPHRPYIDEVTLPCPTCGEEARRVPEVIDAWYDSGAMPFAQWGYPHQGREEFEQAYPAQFICEAIDQTRGWFYTLMAVGTLTFDRSSYENVLCLGHILAEDGRKMSKHLGNILEPMPLMDQHGADALRWFMACSGSPWSARRVGHTVLQDIVRKSLLTYWNTVAFHSLYARTAGFEPGFPPAPPVAERPALDRWAISEAHRLAQGVDAALEDFDTQKAGRLLAAYVDDLSNWYVRRSRRRFWQGDAAALATLHECLYVVTLLMAPITPFITERVWQDLFRPTGPDLPDSVHLARWPVIGDGSLIDDDLAAQMGLARRLVELGRAARADSGVKTRQPLSRALVGAHGWSTLSDDLKAQIAEELYVTRLESLAEAGGDLVDYSAKANFRALGKRFGKGTQPVAAAIAAADPVALATDLRAGRAATIVVDGEELTVDADEVIITETPREGWSVAREGETVALDLAITPELRRAGLAREAVRVIQEARKSSGLEVADRIALEWHAVDAEAVEALREHADLVAAEVLATSVAEVSEAPSGDGVTTTDPDLGFTFRIAKA
jgi:isoleucyl-tRNA synthetase